MLKAVMEKRGLAKTAASRKAIDSVRTRIHAEVERFGDSACRGPGTRRDESARTGISPRWSINLP